MLPWRRAGCWPGEDRKRRPPVRETLAPDKITVFEIAALDEEGSTLGANSLVKKFTRLGAGEVWGGVPARCVKARA